MKFKAKLHWLDPKKLKPYPGNAKVHSEAAIAELARELEAFGWDVPIVILKDFTIKNGHKRHAAALLNKYKRVPCIMRDDLTKAQAIASRISDNKSAESPWDTEKLRQDFLRLRELGNFDDSLTGFNTAQIEELLNPPTSENVFREADHRSVQERKEQYDNSDFRQILLVMDHERFTALMQQFAAAQLEMGVETNTDVVEKLFESHAAHRSC